jgi:hypothetical protein
MKMSTALKVLLVAAALAIVSVLSCFGSAVSWYNDAVALEEATKAQWRDNQNEYDSFWKKVQEIAQVADKYKDDFKGLLVSETQAKFGPEGSKAVMQWFQERQINLDPQMYRKIQDVIESGRDGFKRSQTELLDKQRKFGFHIRSFWGRMWASWYNMPHTLAGELAPPKDIDGDGKLTVLDYPIVTSAKTKAVFQSGEDNAPIDVFGTKK